MGSLKRATMELKRSFCPYSAIVLIILGFASVSNSLTIDDFNNLANINEVPNDGKIWVVLVAGSNGYYNYRHQADVCHAYQIVHKHGIPDENIIVMMYDDIANNKENPKKGEIFNKPNGTDVYKGVPKDYTGKNVTANNFIDILKGKRMNYGSGKTLKSGPNDHVFVYFSDHGAKGLVAFPSTVLHAKTLDKTLREMHANQQFAKMTIYIEACESGSMFKGLLPDNIDIYATTASNATTSSYACYYDDKLKTFLGDVYSVKWMEDSDKENLQKETLEKQYKIVKRETNTSMVCQFGDLSISKMKVADFQGESMKQNQFFSLLSDVQTPTQQKYGYFSYTKTENRKKFPPSFHSCGRDAVPGPEVPRIVLEKQLQTATTQEEITEITQKLRSLLDGRKLMKAKTKDIINQVTDDEAITEKIMISTGDIELTQFDCHKEIVDKFHMKCFNLGCNDFALRQINHFASMCEMGYDEKDILDSIEENCNFDKPICGII